MSAAPQADPLDYSERYNTPIPPERQAEFNQWVAAQTKATGKNPLHDRYDYDVQGDYLAGAGRDERGHGSDQFKKPNHTTFSDQSIYHGKDGHQGGHWNQDAGGNYVSYQPSDTNLQFRSPEELQQYFKQVEPNTKLLPGSLQSVRRPGIEYAGGNVGLLPAVTEQVPAAPRYRATMPKAPAPQQGRTFYGGTP